MHPRELWEGTDPKARVLRGLLTPASWLYAAGWGAYLGLYRLGLKRASEPHRPVLVVGNLSVGGSGKSPTTLHIARFLRDAGREVVVGCSGYGSPRAEGASMAPEGPLNATEWGDEPAMFRWLAPNLPLVVGRRRVLAAQLVHERYPHAILVMDDGFQHLPLRKHVSIVLEAREPVNARCLPAGPYREPRSNLSRADACIGTDAPLAEEGFRLTRGSLRLVRPDGSTVTGLGRSTALCALGNPERFLADLRSHMEIVEPQVLGDHHPLTSGTLLERLPKGLPVIVTAKDWVKLRERNDIAGYDIVIALQDVSVEPADHFQTWLAAKLDESTHLQDP